MNNINHLLMRYRECARSMWNVYFMDQGSHVDWELCDEYEEICGRLFDSLVLNCLGRSAKKSRSFDQSPEFMPFLRVVPSVTSGVRIYINREKKSSPYWDHPITIIQPNDADMRFIDFFDFAKLDVRDFRYIRVRIINSTRDADLIGRDGLIECNDVTVFFDPTV